MSSVFIIDNTDGTLSLTMPPGFLNGPGSGTRDSDLRLYGMGSLLWGEGVNENMLRIAENFACEEKPGNPGNPQDESDLGPGLGITVPLIGQTWYNKTDEQMYYYTGTRWTKTSAVLVNATQPDLPESGDLWFDITNGNGCNNSQLKIYDGTSWLSVAQDYLSLCGGTLSGNLNMGSNTILNLAYPNNPNDAANMQYVIDIETGIRTDLTTHINDLTKHLNTYQNTMIDAIETNASGRTAVALGQDIARMRTFTDTFGSNTVVQELNNRVSKDSDQSMGAGFTIELGRNPTAGSMEAATAEWVEDEIFNAVGAQGGLRAVRFWDTQSASANEGDIHVDGSGNAYMYISSAWRKIFPAQYS